MFARGSCMREKVNFNVIEIMKNENRREIEKTINSIVNKLIVNEFTNGMD